MLGISLMFTFIIIVQYFHKLYKCNKFIHKGYKLVGRYKRKIKLINLGEIYLAGMCVTALVMDNEFAYAFIAYFTVAIITRIERDDDIILIDSCLLFDKTYIEWRQINQVYSDGEDTLVIHSQGIRGKFKITYIERADILAKDIRKVIYLNGKK